MTSVLVTYASKHGATAEIAQEIARVLREYDLDVTARRVEYIDSITEYDAVICGVALYGNEWLAKGVEFLQNYGSELSNRIVFLFASGPTGEGDPLDLVDGGFVPAGLETLLEQISPREITLFKGKIDLRRLAPEDREIIKATGVPRGDYRDWDVIRQWAQATGNALSLKSLVKQPAKDLMIVD